MIYKSLLSASIVGAASASAATPATWRPEFVSGDVKGATSSNLCGGKGTLVAALATSGTDIKILYPHRAGEEETFAVGEIVPADADLVGFAADIECVGDDVTGNILFATRGGTGATAPGLFVYSGSWSAWTEQQFIPGPEETFGTKVTTDDMRTVIVSCPACENSAGEAAGQLYVYKATSPSAKAWTKTQVLELDASKYSSTASPDSSTTLLGAQALVASHGVLVADFLNVDDENEAAIFVRHPDGSYSHQQVLKTGFVATDALAYNRIVTYDGVIAYAENDADVGLVTDVGAVYVLNPFSGVKGKPLPTKWSQQQMLSYDEATVTGTEFGSALFMGEKELVVAATLATTAPGIYSFHNNGKMWSQTAVLTDAEMPGYVAGDFSGEMYQSSLLIASADFTAVLNRTVEDVRCLDISVSDMFGDGWDGAVLRVTGPDGTQDDFAPNCADISTAAAGALDTKVAHLEFKYCPIDASAGGLHKFRVVGGPEAKHNWEINWAVRNQMEDLIIYGGVATEVDFDFNVAQRRFNHLRVHHPLPNATKCIPCADHPPHPIPDMQDDDARWFHLELSDSGAGDDLPWYLRKYGPSFFIGDKESHRLVQAAPFCVDPKSAVTKCWMDVHDGEYTFRVADANYVTAKDRKATVCGVEVTSQQQLIFNISKGVCDSQTMAHDAETMCAAYDVIVHGLGVVVLRGVSVSSLADLSAVDKSALESALLSSISGVAAVDSKLIGVSNGNEFTYKLAFKSSSFGSAPQGGENQERFASIETTIVSQETSTSAGNNIYSFMKAMPLDALNSATGAVVSTFSLVGLGDATTEHLSVQDVEIGAKLTYVNSGSSSQDAFVSMTQGAYVAAGLCAVAVALFVVTRVAPVTKKATPEVQTA